jgi:hypothetical protein
MTRQVGQEAHGRVNAKIFKVQLTPFQTIPSGTFISCMQGAWDD